jgi:hypothetical protein
MVDEMYAGEPFDSADDADLYAELDKVMSSPGSTPEQKEIAEELRQAKRKRDEEETEALQKETERVSKRPRGTPPPRESGGAGVSALVAAAQAAASTGPPRTDRPDPFGDDEDYLHSRFGELKF